MEAQIKREFDKVIETLTFEKIGVLFNHQGKEVEFLKSQILVGHPTKGRLIDFHLTVVGGIGDEQKREAVTEHINSWIEEDKKSGKKKY